MDNKKKAITFQILASISFALMAAMVKFAGDIPIVEKVFFRNLISVFIAYWGVRKLDQSLLGKPGNRKWLLLRSFFGLIGVGLFFYSISYINLADSSMLNRISPFFVMILAAFFLKEKIQKIHIPALLIVFAASLLIIKPQFDLSILPFVAGLGGALCAAVAYTTIRFLSTREHPAVIVFFFSLFSVVSLIPFVIVYYEQPTLTQLLFLVLTGVFAAGGQFGLTYSYRYGKAAEVSLYSYLNVVFAGLIGFVFLGEISDIWTIIGSVIIVATSVFLVLYGNKKKTLDS